MDWNMQDAGMELSLSVILLCALAFMIAGFIDAGAAAA